MSKSKRTNTQPGGHSITPHLVCSDAAAAIEFYKKAFAAEEIMRMPGPGGKLMHAAIKIGDSVVMLVDEMPQWGSVSPLSLKGSPVTIHLQVPNVDEVMAQAQAAGASVAMPAADMFWGDRYGSLVDPFGHKWSVATRIREMTIEEMVKAGEEFQKTMKGDCAEAAAKATEAGAQS